MKLRSTNNNDLQVLAEMNFQLIKDEGHRNTMQIPELKKRMEGWLCSIYQSSIIEEADNVIGYALWREEKDFLYLRQFFIKPNMRRKNYGKNAIDFLINNEWEGKDLRLEVLVKNKSAQAFWNAVGFKEYCLTMEMKNA